MDLKELIRIFKAEWIPVDDLIKLKESEIKEVDYKILKSAKINKEILDKFEAMPLWYKSGILGIGPSKAVELWKAGVRPNNLVKHKTLLPTITQLWLLHKPEDRIPHDIIPKITDDFIPKAYKKKYELVGSYARGRPDSGDVDILLYDVPSEDFLAAVDSKKYIPLSKGPSKLSGMYEYKGKKYLIDLWLTNEEDKIFMRLFATGSKNFNIRMRYVAIIRGYKLNQYGLWDGKTGKKISGLKTEQDVFDKIKMQYKKPEDRQV